MMRRQILLATLAASVAAYAQQNVGINTPTPKATLDVAAKNPDDTGVPEGIIAPRLTGVQLKAKSQAYATTSTDNHTGAIVYVTDAVDNTDPNTADPKTALVTAAGYYYFDGNKWQPMATASSASLGWFYMPSFNLDVTQGTHTVDLYQEYVRQFTKTGNTRFASSDSGYNTATNTTLPSADKLVFVVTDYDTNVIASVSIDPLGVMSYTVQPNAVVSAASYINILVKLK